MAKKISKKFSKNKGKVLTWDEKKKQFFLVITKALTEHKILNGSQLKQISELEIF